MPHTTYAWRTFQSQNSGQTMHSSRYSGVDFAVPICMNMKEVRVLALTSEPSSTQIHQVPDIFLGPMAIPTQDRPHPLTGEQLPVVMGHEFCGTIKSVNEGSSWKLGQKVMVDPRLQCGSCTACKSTRDHQCLIIGSLGLTGRGGGLSEVVLVEERKLHAVPDHVSLEHAALAEPLSVAHHAVKRAGFQDLTDKTVLVVGGGPVGYAVVLTLKAAGAKKIVVSEPTETRRKQISTLAHAIIDPRIEDVGERCRKLTDGCGVEVAFDCAGVQKGLDAAFDAMAYNGVWVSMSLWHDPMVPPFGLFLVKELTLRTSMLYSSEDFKEVMEMLAQGTLSSEGPARKDLTAPIGKYSGLGNMVTSRIPLDDVVTRGFMQLTEMKDEHIKILVIPKKSGAS